MDREEQSALPGLSFEERPQLFQSLLDWDGPTSDASVQVALADRPALLLRSGQTARAMLTSTARKGRPVAGLRRIGGYVGLLGERFTKSRADVLAALRRGSKDVDHLATCLSWETTSSPELRFDAVLLGHLAGTEVTATLQNLSSRARGILRFLADDPDGGEMEAGELHEVHGAIQAQLTTRSSFVRELLRRGWTIQEIAVEITTLTFAGWASLAAAARSGVSLGVTGSEATDDAVTELLRVAPPGWLIVREACEPTQLLPDDEPVPEGTLLVTSPWLLHRDPSVWSLPDEFDTSRVDTRRSASYLPFSVGTRACPAEAYSRAFLRIGLASIPEVAPSRCIMPALTDERSACLIPMEGATCLSK